MEKQVFFRADANPILGSGHIMRCLSIAAELQKQGISCTFVTADHGADKLLASRNIKKIVLNTQWDSLDDEIPVMEGLLEAEKPLFLLVDHYYVTPEYLGTLQKNVKVVYIDDRRAFCYPCDVLINYNLFALDWKSAYAEEYKDTNTQLLLGPQFTPLREEFQAIPDREVKKQAVDVLISTGGADPINLAGSLLAQLQIMPQLNDICFHFVIGALNPNLEKLKQAAAGLPNVKLHIQVEDMKSLMLRSDIAIAAAGSTLYELCACGVPTVTYILADNQIPGAVGFARCGLMCNAGDCRKSQNFAYILLNKMLSLTSDSQARSAMSSRCREFIDGKGARHLVEALLSVFT